MKGAAVNTSVRIAVRVQMGNALQVFNQLRSQIDMLDKTQQRAGASSTVFGKRMSDAFNGIGRASARLTQTGRILLYNFTLPIVGAFTLLERQMLRNQTQTALLSQVYTTAAGASAQFGGSSRQVTSDLANLDKVATILSNTFGVSKDSVLGLMVTFGRAGVAGVQLAQDTELAVNLMAGFQVTATEASDAILQVGINYKLTGDQIRVAMGVITDVSQQTRADVGTLIAGFVKAAPAAAQLGIDVVHLAAYLGVMQQAGFKGAESGTALNFALTRLVKATPEASKLFKNLGLDMNQSSFAAADGSKRMDMVFASLNKLSDAQRQYAIAVLFGVRQQPKLTSLISDAISKQGLYNSLLRREVDAKQILARMDNAVALAMDNSATKFNILKTQLINNFTIIANDLTPALLAVTNMLVEASRWFARLGDSAGGRRIQALIILGAVLLALAGPVAILAGAIGSLITLFELVGGAAVALISGVFSPIGIALVTLAILAFKFRDQFISAFQSMIAPIFAIAQAIYSALQWINPFARHSPSLVERTRDGVAAMIGYWRGLTPIMVVMDSASAAVKRLTTAMAGFTAAQSKADLAKMRSAVVKVGGRDAGGAFDATVAANNKLAASLPQIEKQYANQAKVVDAAKVALDAANKTVDAASTKLDGLKAKQQSLQDALQTYGDPTALSSQAAALSSMGRQLAEAGNTGLAAQFGAQAATMNDHAAKAAQAKTQLDQVDRQIKDQEESVRALTAARDALQKTYDTENANLQLLADGYAAVKKQIDDNTAALQSMAQAAEAAIAAAAAAAKKHAKAAAAGGLPPAFSAAAGGNFDAFGAGAIPKGLPGAGAVPSFDKYIKDLNARSGKLLQGLFPNPLKMFTGWFDQVKALWTSAMTWIDRLLGRHRTLPSLGDGPHGAQIGGVATAVGGGLQGALSGAKSALGTIDWKRYADEGSKAWASIQRGLMAFVDAVKGPFRGLGVSVRNSLGLLLMAGRDILQVFGKHLGPVLDGFAKFWATNGKQIGQIIGFIAAQVIDFGKQMLDVVDIVFKILWPVVKFTLDAILGIFQGVWKTIEGLLTFIIQLLTGNFAAAFRGLGQMLSGVWDIIINGLKALAGLVVLALAGLAALLLDEVVAGLAEIGPLFARFGEKIPGWIWKAFTALWKDTFALGQFIVDWLDTVAPGLATSMGRFGEKIPGWIWDAVKAAWRGAFNLVEFLGARLNEYSVGAAKVAGDFAAKLPGWMWNGVKTAWSKAWDLVGFIGARLGEYVVGLGKVTEAFGEHLPHWLWTGFTRVWVKTFDFISYVSMYLQHAANSLIDDGQLLGRKIPGWIWSGVRAVWSATFQLTRIIGEALVNAGVAIARNTIELGAAMIRGIVQGVRSIPGALTGAVTGALNDALNAGKKLLHISSPSRVFADQVGAPIMQGLALGVGNNAHLVSNSLIDSLDAAHANARRYLASASLTLPTLTQRVALSYSGALTSLPTAALPVRGGDGASVTAPGGDTYHQHFAIDATKSEATDPMALAAVIAWNQRTQVRP